MNKSLILVVGGNAVEEFERFRGQVDAIALELGDAGLGVCTIMRLGCLVKKLRGEVPIKAIYLFDNLAKDTDFDLSICCRSIADIVASFHDKPAIGCRQKQRTVLKRYFEGCGIEPTCDEFVPFVRQAVGLPRMFTHAA